MYSHMGDNTVSNYKDVYNSGAENYDLLVSYEDYEGNLLRTLQSIVSWDGKTVVELGAGTARLSKLVVPFVAQLWMTDISAHMLSVGVPQMQALGLPNWGVFLADSRAVPMPNACADIAMAGWCYGHCTEWDAPNWKAEIARSVHEMQRLLRVGGTAIILETLGTGQEDPSPPAPLLGEYYHWLETEMGYTRIAIRTDYRFPSAQEAERLARFFFGDAMGDAVAARNSDILPECTGVWWRVYP